MNNSKNDRMSNNPELFAMCQRCEEAVVKGKTPTIILKDKTMYFCDGCFKSVFKYDETLKTLPMIYQASGMKVPFTVRSSNWHRSSYMVIKEVKTTESKSGKPKMIFVGDMYLRTILKEQNRPVGKSNFFLWTSWSEELAQKYKEEPRPEDNKSVPA